MNLVKAIKNFVYGAMPKTIAQTNYVYMANTIHGQLDCSLKYIKKAYQVNADVYSITSFIAGKVATVPFNLYEIKNDKALLRYKAMSATMRNTQTEILKTKALQAVESDHKILRMLNKAPNEYMTAGEFKFGFTIYRLLTGNSFIRGFAPENEPGKFVELHLLPSQQVSPIGGSMYAPVRAYKLTWDPGNEIDVMDVAHSRYFNPDFEWPTNPHIIGQSPLQAAANIVLQSNSGDEAMTTAFQNGGEAGILYQDGGQDLSDAQRDMLQDHIDKKVSGSKNYKQILAASSKLGWLKIGSSPVDLNILEALNATLRRLCNIFHVNSAVFNDPENKSYNNISEARKAAITDAVLPELTAMRDAFNLWLIPGWEKADGKKYFIDYDSSVFPELQANMKETAEWLNVAWWLTPNEKRTQQDYDTLGNEYDVPFIPVGHAPLGSGNPEYDIDFQKAFNATGDLDYKN